MNPQRTKYRILLASTLWSCLLLTGRLSIAQTSNYVVTVRNDTLRGEVKTNSIQENNESITLRGSDRKKKTFTPNQARVFKLRDQTYHSVLLVNRYVFMRVIESGYLSAYEHQTIGRQSNLAEVNQYLKMNMGELVLVPKIGFRKRIAPILQDCPLVQQKVESKEYDFVDLKRIATEYNQCLANRPPAGQAAIPSNTHSATAPPTTNAAAVLTPAGPASGQVGELLTYLAGNQQTANREDLTTCLTDINTKLTTGVTVPKYLLEALVNLSKPTEAIRDKALKVATELGYQAGK